MMLLKDRPLLQQRVAQAMAYELHPSGAGQPHYNMQQGGLHFQWHPSVQKVYWLKPVFGADGKQTHFTGQVIATDIVDHGQAWNAVLIWKRGYDEGQNPGSRSAMNEGKDG